MIQSAPSNKSSFAFRTAQHNYDFQKGGDLANLWCAAFVIRKRMTDDEMPGTRSSIFRKRGSSLNPQTGLFGETFMESGRTAKVPAKISVQSSTLSGAIGITSGHLADFAKGAELPDGLMKDALYLADQYSFFHWHLAFPEVFKHEGFDVILGNPPWERVKLQEKEWFAERRPDIADAPNAAARKQLIKSLAMDAPALYAAFSSALRQAEGESHLIRNGNIYPLCGRGDINLYAIFAERAKGLAGTKGRVGLILPSGIATDDTTKLFFQQIVETRSLVSVYHFENEEKLFAQVHHAFRFVLLTLGTSQFAEFVFYARRLEHLSEERRRFVLSAEDFAILNPNTKTCPTFRSARDAEISKGVYRRVSILFHDNDHDAGPWSVQFLRMLDMANNSESFRTLADLLSNQMELRREYISQGRQLNAATIRGKDALALRPSVWHV